MTNRLQVGIDFSQKGADFCLMFPDGQPLELHRAFDNSRSGYSLAKQLMLNALDSYQFDGIDIPGEATAFYWLPFFLQLAADPDLFTSPGAAFPTQSPLGPLVHEVLRPGR